jgi:hypothetical protein
MTSRPPRLRPHRVARVPGEPRGGDHVRAGHGEGGLLRYHVLDRPIPVLLLRPRGVLRPLSFAMVLFYSPQCVEGKFSEVQLLVGERRRVRRVMSSSCSQPSPRKE